MMSAASQNGEAPQIDSVPNLDWYIYYHVRADHAVLLQTRVTAMQRRLLQHYGIAGALKRRPQLRDGLHTWMEVYTSAPNNFEAILAPEVESAALSELIDGERHVEHFWDLSSCA